MLKSLLILFCLSSLFLPSTDSRKVFDEFQSAYRDRDFKRLDKVLSPDFVAIDELGQVAFKKKDYCTMLANWSAIFNTRWNVKSVVVKGDSVMTVEDDTDVFDNYFWQGKMEFRYTYVCNSTQLVSLRWDSLPGYTKRKYIYDQKIDSFYRWIYQSHPEKTNVIQNLDSAGSLALKNLFFEYLYYSKNK